MCSYKNAHLISTQFSWMLTELVKTFCFVEVSLQVQKSGLV